MGMVSKPLRALVLVDDYWHPARTPRAGLSPLEEAGFAFDWIEQASEWSAERMAAYPVTILTKSNEVSAADKTPWVTEAVAQAFINYVERGNGLVVIHSGSVYADVPLMRSLIGGAFAHHPPQCPVTVEPRADHLLGAGVNSFTAMDEHYHMYFDDPQADVFLTTRSEHGAQPGGWTRLAGRGRVCVLTPGHNLDVWLQPSYQTLISNALHWCNGAA
jgi:type 1 glutamine amidotransferase